MSQGVKRTSTLPTAAERSEVLRTKCAMQCYAFFRPSNGINHWQPVTSLNIAIVSIE